MLQKSLNRLQTAALHSNFENKDLVCRIAYIALLSIAVLFLAASVILLAVYFSSAGLVISYFESQPQSMQPQNGSLPSLPDGLTYTAKYATEFFTTGIKSGRVLTNESVNEFVDSTMVSGKLQNSGKIAIF